jgi:hypothetical protein
MYRIDAEWETEAHDTGSFQRRLRGEQQHTGKEIQTNIPKSNNMEPSMRTNSPHFTVSNKTCEN